MSLEMTLGCAKSKDTHQFKYTCFLDPVSNLTSTISIFLSVTKMPTDLKGSDVCLIFPSPSFETVLQQLGDNQFCALRPLTPVFGLFSRHVSGEPRRRVLWRSTVTNCRSGSSGGSRQVFYHKDCLFCFTWTISVFVSFFFYSSPFVPVIISFRLPFSSVPLLPILIRWVGGGGILLLFCFQLRQRSCNQHN